MRDWRQENNLVTRLIPARGVVVPVGSLSDDDELRTQLAPIERLDKPKDVLPGVHSAYKKDEVLDAVFLLEEFGLAKLEPGIYSVWDHDKLTTGHLRRDIA